MKKLWNCGSCGHGAMPVETHSFCSACGKKRDHEPIVEPKNSYALLGDDFFLDHINCMSCQTPLLTVYSFCISCGEKVSQVQETSNNAPKKQFNEVMFKPSKPDLQLKPTAALKHRKGSVVQTQAPSKKKNVTKNVGLSFALIMTACFAFVAVDRGLADGLINNMSLSAKTFSKVQKQEEYCQGFMVKYRGKRLSKKGKKHYNRCLAVLDLKP